MTAKPAVSLAEIRTGEQILAASLSPLAEEMCSSGVLTPDHVIRTKNQAVFIDRIPADDESLMARIREKIIDFTKDYDRYFKVHAHVLAEGVKRLDPYPRVFLVKGLGLIALGATGKQARIAADIAESTFAAKIKSAATGRYKATDPRHVFDLEYWGLQQKKLDSAQPPLLGQAALVSGGGGAIALGIADRILAAGGEVALTDINEKRLEMVREILTARYGPDRVETLVFDITDYEAVAQGVEKASLCFGGLDLVVPKRRGGPGGHHRSARSGKAG